MEENQRTVSGHIMHSLSLSLSHTHTHTHRAVCLCINIQTDVKVMWVSQRKHTKSAWMSSLSSLSVSVWLHIPHTGQLEALGHMTWTRPIASLLMFDISLACCSSHRSAKCIPGQTVDLQKNCIVHKMIHDTLVCFILLLLRSCVCVSLAAALVVVNNRITLNTL